MPPPDDWRFADRECGLTVCKCPDFIFWSLCYAVRVTAHVHEDKRRSGLFNRLLKYRR